MKVNGEYLTYADNGNRDVGLYVDKNEIVAGRYFEIEILSLGRSGIIALGLVPDDYPANNQPGWKENSIGYHGDDGRLYHERGTETQFGPTWHVGDKIGLQTYMFLTCRLEQGQLTMSIFAYILQLGCNLLERRSK
ncbi:SPRY domain-containing protein 3-like isoform X2 [Ruditapes philippinarum]|uniref:SPRY domain-containing protein 3-like isoform X2 n=1 Tax=Ruditapes philippinarum TaxID=129788 RepID=UPI00295B9E05|nr:SPRY domain-containing protein 3-like isoform X2 [Ruditapes philippinarum]